MSSNQHVSMNVDIGLERRLELLESRFTTPSHAKPMQETASSPEVATVVGSGGSQFASQHSFGFDAPSGSSSNGSGGSNMSSLSNLDKGLVRSKKQRQSSRLSSFDEVRLAAERQMQRVVAKSPLMMETSNHGASSQFSNTASNQTILTSHKSSQDEPSKPRVVAESPPILTTLHSPNNPGSGQLKATAAKPAPVTVDKRKSLPVKRQQPTVTEAVPGKTASSTPPAGTARKRTRLNFTSDETCKSPKVLMEISTNSRSNPGKPGKKKVPNDNNRKIDHFFSAVKRHASDMTVKDSTPLTSIDSELDHLRLRCEDLEKIIKDKDDQLKAVSNNQTILNTALKASLCQREKEIKELRKSKERDAARSSHIIEKLIRAESSQEAKELRQKLASDGARLGRITYTRAGLRTVESWEEGHASKLLQRRKLALEAKNQTMLDRQATVERAAKALSEGQEVVDTIGGLVLNNALAIMDAQESVRLHLDGISKLEDEIKKEEQALNNEKTEHIRALKRIASEDASRFRSRPKLNDRYVLLSLLGKGGFSEVWRAFDLCELKEVAVKIHQLDPRWNEAKKDNYTKHVSREYEIHRAVRHPRIVSLFDVFEIDNNAFATVLECCNGTDLDSLLKEKNHLPERDARAILLQILSGMNYLSHSSGNRQGIIHYDLKPGNILFDEFGDAKITDFGLSKIVDTPDPAESMELTSQGAGTYWYLPPECFITSETVRISNKVDVWSIGVIYYQMLFGKRPFGDGMSQDRVLTDNTMLNAREVHFPDSIAVSPEGKEFVKLCLTYDQAYRPTIGQLCNDPYVVSKNF